MSRISRKITVVEKNILLESKSKLKTLHGEKSEFMKQF